MTSCSNPLIHRVTDTELDWEQFLESWKLALQVEFPWDAQQSFELATVLSKTQPPCVLCLKPLGPSLKIFLARLRNWNWVGNSLRSLGNTVSN